MLLHIPDILSADQVADFRRRLDAADWTDGRETVGHLGAQAKHNQQLPEGSPLRRELGEIILVALARHPLFFMVRDDVQRRLLWEMDGSIERLRQTGGDAEAVLQLTGVYHNLLRRWSEV